MAVPTKPDRLDIEIIPSRTLWKALSETPGVGVTLMDTEGRLLFVNATACFLFFNNADTDYYGKTIADFHPPGYVRERIEMVNRVVQERRPLALKHIYHGRRICSTVWPCRDNKPPFNRVIVVSHGNLSEDSLDVVQSDAIESISTEYVDLGPLNILSKRELEVLVLLGHGLSVPKTASLLHRSPKTIERHKSSIGQKLGLHGQAEMVATVTAMGLDLSDTRLKRY